MARMRTASSGAMARRIKPVALTRKVLPMLLDTSVTYLPGCSDGNAAVTLVTPIDGSHSIQTDCDSTVSRIQASGLRITAPPGPAHRWRSFSKSVRASAKVSSWRSIIIRVVHGSINLVAADTRPVSIHRIALECSFPAFEVRDGVLDA